jgi:hypothetical protein
VTTSTCVVAVSDGAVVNGSTHSDGVLDVSAWRTDAWVIVGLSAVRAVKAVSAVRAVQGDDDGKVLMDTPEAFAVCALADTNELIVRNRDKLIKWVVPS